MKLLEKPDTKEVLDELRKFKSVTVGSLIGFMHVYNLRFAAATTPKQKMIYEKLCPLLDNARDKVMNEPRSKRRNRSSRPQARRRLLQQDGPGRLSTGKPRKMHPSRQIRKSEKTLGELTRVQGRIANNDEGTGARCSRVPDSSLIFRDGEASLEVASVVI